MSPTDPATFTLVALLLLVVTIVACYIPAGSTIAGMTIPDDYTDIW